MSWVGRTSSARRRDACCRCSARGVPSFSVSLGPPVPVARTDCTAARCEPPVCGVAGGALIIQLTAVGVITAAAAPFYADQILHGGRGHGTRYVTPCCWCRSSAWRSSRCRCGRCLCGRTGQAAGVLRRGSGIQRAFASTTAVGERRSTRCALICAQVACVGLCYGGTQVIPYSMLTDTLCTLTRFAPATGAKACSPACGRPGINWASRLADS
jgi:hypothetical protein